MIRNSCLKCFCKHVGEAIILISEAEQGYFDQQYWALASSHLSEAADESVADYPELASACRAERLKYMDYVIGRICCEAEVEVAQEYLDAVTDQDKSLLQSKLLEAKEKYNKWTEAIRSDVYKPDLMSLLSLATLAIKETHKNSGEDYPLPSGQRETSEIPQPDKKLNKQIG
jgi:hypothetical protein